MVVTLNNTTLADYNKYLDKEAVVSYYVATQNQQKDSVSMFVAATIPSSICIIISVFAGLLMVVTSISMRFFEMRRQIAVMQTFGFSPSRISFMLLSENLLQFIIALVFAIPVGKVLLDALNKITEIKTVTFSDYFFPTGILLGAGLTLFYIVIAIIPYYFKIRKMNLASELKILE